MALTEVECAEGSVLLIWYSGRGDGVCLGVWRLCPAGGDVGGGADVIVIYCLCRR